MAAEKLTKARMAQICVVLLVLLSAFFWRTMTYLNTAPVSECDLKSGKCEIFSGKDQIIINLLDDNEEKALIINSTIEMENMSIQDNKMNKIEIMKENIMNKKLKFNYKLPLTPVTYPNVRIVFKGLLVRITF